MTNPAKLAIDVARCLRCHYLSDVVGGWALSLAWVAALELFGVRQSTARSSRNVLLAPFYALYSARLRRSLRRGPLPRHVAVILDGNRRWALRAGFADPGAA